MPRKSKSLFGYFLVLAIAFGIGIVFYFNLLDYLNYYTLKQYHADIKNWAQEHYLLALGIYLILFISAVALSIPSSLFFTIVGGYLFGPVAIIYIVFSATAGATILFLIVKHIMSQWINRKFTPFLIKMRNGFNENAFNYLLFLRLMPIFPFWLINIVAALLGVRLSTFIIATFIGIIPISWIYALVGNSLQTILESNEPPHLAIILSPTVLLSFVGLGIAALLPVAYKRWKRKS